MHLPENHLQVVWGTYGVNKFIFNISALEIIKNNLLNSIFSLLILTLDITNLQGVILGSGVCIKKIYILKGLLYPHCYTESTCMFILNIPCS